MKKLDSFKISFFVVFIYCVFAIVLLLTEYAELGGAMFCALPLAIGLSSGMLPDLKESLYGMFLSLVIFSVILVFTKIEGIICLLMAAPILIFCSWLGWLIGQAFRKNKEKSLKLSFAPLTIFVLVNLFEVFNGVTFDHKAVSTTFEINGTPEQVYNSIIAVDTVNVETSLLQKVGLPIPRKCELSAPEVGGTRYCEFEEGYIIERITALEPNRYLRMDVEECHLSKERHWLKFEEDIYQIQKINEDKTQITRTTTYKSNLKPRFYWDLMERITIQSEQDFVFRNLVKDVKKIQQ